MNNDVYVLFQDDLNGENILWKLKKKTCYTFGAQKAENLSRKWILSRKFFSASTCSPYEKLWTQAQLFSEGGQPDPSSLLCSENELYLVLEASLTSYLAQVLALSQSKSKFKKMSDQGTVVILWLDIKPKEKTDFLWTGKRERR